MGQATPKITKLPNKLRFDQVPGLDGGQPVTLDTRPDTQTADVGAMHASPIPIRRRFTTPDVDPYNALECPDGPQTHLPAHPEPACPEPVEGSKGGRAQFGPHLV